MPPRERNSLREEGQPREQTEGKSIINSRTQRTARLVCPDGSVQEFLLDINDTRPDENGNWLDNELINVTMDRAGNPLPKDLRSVKLSNSDLYISSSDQSATCTSWLHGNRSRNILVGQDGRELGNGRAICDRCAFILTTIYLALGIIALGLVLGIWKGAGLF